MASNLIKVESLTTWAVTSSGERVQLGFEDETNRPYAVSLPVAQLSALMMTIPSMLRQALEVRFGDSSMRMIHQLGNWQVERAVGSDSFILSLTTTDGFEVTFAVASPQAEQLGKGLRHAADQSAKPGVVVN